MLDSDDLRALLAGTRTSILPSAMDALLSGRGLPLREELRGRPSTLSDSLSEKTNGFISRSATKKIFEKFIQGSYFYHPFILSIMEHQDTSNPVDPISTKSQASPATESSIYDTVTKSSTISETLAVPMSRSRESSLGHLPEERSARLHVFVFLYYCIYFGSAFYNISKRIFEEPQKESDDIVSSQIDFVTKPTLISSASIASMRSQLMTRSSFSSNQSRRLQFLHKKSIPKVEVPVVNDFIQQTNLEEMAETSEIPQWLLYMWSSHHSLTDRRTQQLIMDVR